ncbi:MAG TPA: hypothetical protein VKB76_10375, partial [Ktedonobacterales bacterium]|nr:hypothetical protein [Ktedonobacterales bacterium]
MASGLVVTALAGLRDESVFLANAFVDDDTFDGVHEWTSPINPPSNMAHRATLAAMPYRCLRRYDTASLAAFTGRALMIFRAGFALNIVG